MTRTASKSRSARDVLEQEAAGAGVQRVVHVLVEVEGGQHQDPRAGRVGRDDPPGRLDPVHDRHAHVHQHDVGALLAAQPHGLRAVGRGADDGEVRLGVEQRRRSRRARPPGRRRLRCGSAAHGVALGIGRTASTTNPPPGAGPGRERRRRPSRRARACPARPCPPVGVVRPVPGPLSRTRTQQRVRAVVAARRRPPRPVACRRALVSASCTMR